MSSVNFRDDKASDESSVNQEAAEQVDVEVEDPFADDIVDETPEFHPSVEQETYAKVERNHPETMVGREENEFGHLTLVQEERIRGREEELELISAKATFGTQEGREKRTEKVVVEARSETRREWTDRTVGWNADPRPRLEQVDLGAVNRQAARIAERIDGGPSRSLLSRKLAEAVACGTDITEAAFETLEWAKGHPGVVVPIEDVADVDAPLGEVDVEGEIIALWKPSGAKVSQVGLIADETEKIKFTTWRSSEQPTLRVGDEVHIRNAEKDWWRGTCNLAVGWRSEITFVQEGDRPAPELAEPSEPRGDVGPSPDVVSAVEQQSMS